jgi:hypothetical protein
MKIEATNTINTNGFSLAGYLSCTLNEVIQAFPNGRMEGYEDDGFDGREIGFITENGDCFYVYARNGIARIGCIGGWHNPNWQEIKSFIESKIKN